MREVFSRQNYDWIRPDVETSRDDSGIAAYARYGHGMDDQEQRVPRSHSGAWPSDDVNWLVRHATLPAPTRTGPQSQDDCDD